METKAFDDITIVASDPLRRFGSLTFIRFLICFACVSTKATLPSLLCGAP